MYDEDAESIIEENKRVYAKYTKTITRNGENIDKYQIMFAPQGSAYNFAIDPAISRYNEAQFKLRNVGQDAFKFYIKYLRTRNTLDWKAANRKVVR